MVLLKIWFIFIPHIIAKKHRKIFYFLKKIMIIFSFVLISVFSVGSYFLHLFYLENYKQDFKEYILKNKKETAFTIINIDSNELYVNSALIIWEDDNEEVVYKGILYDIVHIEKVGNRITLSVVSDKQETELKKQFASVYDINSGTTTKHPFELLKNFFALKYIVYNTSFEFGNSALKCVSPDTQISFQITTMVISQETPPPDFCI
jgi:hypothetical protein